MKTTALIIDDEPDIRELISLSLTRMGIDCHTAANLADARNLLKNYRFDVCLTDMKLPDGNGVDFVSYLSQQYAGLPVAVITAHGNMDAAVEAMKNGAFDFVSKPVDLQKLRALVTSAVASGYRDAANDSKQRQTDTRSEHPSVAPADTSMPALIGDGQAIKELRKMILKLAQSNAPVWITGESGTGKELAAQLIHSHSARHAGPFIAINCGAIPSELMESELFGHRKGSFTGAVTDNPGLFLKADGGTLFLDEVAELPLHMQVKLLRAIQEKAVRAVGSSEEKTVNVRILSATHKNLEQEVNHGTFRHDLYYRLNVIKLRCPPLQERQEDIPQLARFLLQKICNLNKLQELSLSDEALRLLQHYRFPGNVRELENTLERAAALSEGAVITAQDLDIQSATDIDETATPLIRALGAAPNRKGEKQLIIDALESTRWNRKAAADKMKMTYRQLRYRIKQYNLDSSDDNAS